MGLRFRRSFKAAPGVRINLGKKGVSASFGVRGAHYTVHSSGRKTASVGLPGTGLSYMTSWSDKKKRKTAASSASRPSASPAAAQTQYKARPAPAAPWYRSYAGYWILGGIGLLIGVAGAPAAPWMLLFAVAGIACIVAGFRGRGIAKRTPVEADVWTNLPPIPVSELQTILCPGGDWKQLAAAAQIGLPQWTRIAAESAEIMGSTVQPDVFFPRLATLRDMARKISAASCVLKLPDCPPTDLLESFDEETEPQIVAFLERSHRAMAEKAALLKTENGRRNRRVKYYSGLLPYADAIIGRAAEQLAALMDADGIMEEELTK